MERLSTSITVAWFGNRSEPIPWLRWTLLGLVAVIGSLLYGASLALVIPGWTTTAAALWLAISAGLAWCVLIPVLCAVSQVRFAPCVDACLVTMAWGEAVLGLGALTNLTLWSHAIAMPAASINIAIVALSNVVMALALTRQLQTHGIPPGQVLAAWMLALNGSGALFFFTLHQWLHQA